MGLTRRSFLTGAVPVVAGVVVAIEETTRRIFLPPRGGWAIQSLPFKQPNVSIMALLEQYQKEWNATLNNSVHEALTTGQSFLKAHSHDGQVFWRSIKGDEFYQASSVVALT